MHHVIMYFYFYFWACIMAYMFYLCTISIKYNIFFSFIGHLPFNMDRNPKKVLRHAKGFWKYNAFLN